MISSVLPETLVMGETFSTYNISPEYVFASGPDIVLISAIWSVLVEIVVLDAPDKLLPLNNIISSLVKGEYCVRLTEDPLL